MQYKLQTLLATAAIFTGSILYAQTTVSTFDDLELPGDNTDYCSTFDEAIDYEFTSGDVTFYGVREPWGGYGAFNYTNIVDTATEGFPNDKGAITGNGYDASDNYAVAYASADWPENPFESIQIGAKLTGDAAGNVATGMYLTNTTYAYYYMKENYASGDFYRLIVRGFLDGVQSDDSVEITLGEFTTEDTILIRTWEWVDLVALGHVDSLTFQVVSSDDYTPFYFAIDNLTTIASCPVPQNINATDIAENFATINWDESLTSFTTGYEIAVDESATLAPSGSGEVISDNTYLAEDLIANTVYYAHLRSACDDGSYSEWDTASFKTLAPSSLNNIKLPAISVSPNPATNILYINTPAAVNAIVYGTDGKQLIRSKHTRSVDISSLSAGIYLIRITDKDSRQIGAARFVKTN